MEELTVTKDGTKSNGKYEYYCDYPYETPAGYQYYDYSPPATVPFKLDLEPQGSHSYYRPRDVDLRPKGMKAELTVGGMHSRRGSGDGGGGEGLRVFDNGGGRRDVNDGFGMESRGAMSRGERLNRETGGARRALTVPAEGLERREIMENTETDTGQKRICSMFILILVLIVVIFVIVAALVLYFNYAADEVKARGSEGDFDSCQGIFCPYGECYQGQCQCPEECPSNRAVCGTDGTTYASECHLQRRACASGANTSFLHFGSCQISTEPCEDLQCRTGEVCIVSSSGEPKCQCRSHCPQDDEHRPVCGSDGSDYQSQCELSRAACAVKKQIEVRYVGMCDPCGHVVCATGQVCIVDDARVPRCQCNSSCSTTLSPVCASDGRTYSNECVMNFEACSRRRILAVMYRGECSSGVNPCGAVRCGTGQGCVVNQYGVATCQCRQWCPPILRPVCGTDGTTYDSKCHLHRESCLSQSSVKIAFVGSCGSGGPCEGYKCEAGGICVEKYGQAECECPKCGGEYEPVCGSDRRTYHSRCLLERNNCVERESVQLLHEGPCDACKGIDCGEFGMCEVDSEGFGRCSCHTNCSQALGGQVCGSDGETYASECHLHMKACSSQNQIKVSHKGNCDLCLDVHCKYGARCEGGRCICPTDCPEKREPVCGSDRVTYSNECVMRKVACEKNEDVSYLFFGECDEIGGIVTDVIYPTPLPPTNPEDPCHAHKCIAGAKCVSEQDGHARCVCDFYCSPPPRYEPVCGSDLEFYESECLMRLHACNIQVELFVVPVEDCAVAQRSRACNGTSPLINPSTGEDLFCGEGGTICPPGTYCHKNHDFAKCCRDNSVRIAVIEAPVPDDCEQSEFGCCADGINFARGPDSEGCPEGCRCHRLGALSESCEAVSGRCECRPGVGGNNCDRCLPGYYGLHRISEGSIGCTPCGCSRFGSLRSDCKQMTGECVCKPGVSGHRCTECPPGKVLRPEGCVYDDSLVPQATTCDLLHCHFGGICQEESGIASCTCINHCLPVRMSGGLAVCGSNRVTYSSECELNHQACVQQADIVVVAFGSCSESWTDAPVRRSTAEDGWGTAEWAWVARGHTEHHALATRRHLDTAHFTRAHPIHLVHFINTIIESPPTGVTPITPLDSEEENLVSPPRPTWLYAVPAFSGHSYLQMMPWSVPSKVQLEIEFAAHQLDGVLLYVQQSVEGDGDFLALVLDKGFLELRIDLGNGPVIIRSTTQITPFMKTLVSIRTYNRDALLQIGVGESFSGRSSGMHRALDIHAPLYVGGVPSFTPRIMENVGVSRGFSGCVYSLKVGQRDLDLVWGRSGSVSHGYNVTDCRPSPCAGRPCKNGGTCHASQHATSYVCSCPKTHTGVRCEISVNEGCKKLKCPPRTTCQTLLASSTLHCVPDSPLDTYELEESWPIADLSGDGYLSLPRSEGVSEGLTLELWFLARAPHGMLLYGGQGPTHKGDFISLNLAAGFVQFRFDVGPGVVNLTSKREIREGEWHRVVATWEGGRASLQLDKDAPVTCEAPGPPNTLTLNTPLYLGGFKLWYMVNRDSGILVGLDGALQRLLVNGVVYDRLLEAATEQRGVSRYRGPPCLPNPCFNAAICVPLLNDFFCKCSFMFVGRLCDQALMNIDLDQPIHFDGSTSVLYPGQFLLSFNKSEMFVPWSHPDYDYLNYDEVEHQLLDQVAEENDLDFKKERVQGRTHDIIEISFRAEDVNGLLVWVSHGKGSGRGRADYLALALVGGLPQLALNLGRSRKPFVLTSTTGVNDGSWHVVRVTRRWRRVLLKVDNHRPVRGRALRGPSTLHTDGNLWIGGQRTLPSHLGPAFHTGFRGCVDRLLVDGRELHLVHHAASRHLQFCHTFT
ncbi:agrin-like [Macrobrachium rosenbergii]|uniref:agrin-like n=1 Tax=Macrobrachium rosenbergii TaxID=79674 RepID=UPI0034D7557E